MINLNKYEHFMLKEIEEQPHLISEVTLKYMHNNLIPDELLEELKSADKIYIGACGTSMHASLLGKYFFEKFLSKPVEVLIASEAAYNLPLLSNNPFFIYVSQSGETGDVIKLINVVKEKGIKSLAIVNKENSTIGRLCDYELNVYAGEEKAIASTKAYLGEALLFLILTNKLNDHRTFFYKDLNELIYCLEDIIQNKNKIEKMSIKLVECNDLFYLGKGMGYLASMEASLKLKETSYIHSEAYTSGEFKHGTMALVKEGIVAISLIDSLKTKDIIRMNVDEARLHGADIIHISYEDTSNMNDDFIIKNIPDYLRTIPLVVVNQYLAYYTSLKRGNNVDKPRNLVKAVVQE